MRARHKTPKAPRMQTGAALVVLAVLALQCGSMPSTRKANYRCAVAAVR